MLFGEIPGVNKPVPRLFQGALRLVDDDMGATLERFDAMYEAGATAFDTAHVYGSGKVDRGLGAWINARGLREKIVVLGKGAHHNDARQRVTPFDISSDIHDTLARMETDYIDLYILHRDNPTVPVGPIVERLNQHLDAGHIHAFGGSNWSVARLAEANAYAVERGLVPFAASSPQYSLAEQLKEPWPNCVSISGEQGREERVWYREQQMPLFTWSSLGGGFFSGRLRRDTLDQFAQGDYFDQLVAECYISDANFERLDRVETLAAEKGMSIPQIALAYIMRQPLNIFALVGCQNPDEFKANMAAIEVELTPDELAWLDLEKDER